MRTPVQIMRYRDLNNFFQEHFGFRVQKISIDAGFTCPNRDGTISLDGCIYCDEKGSGTGLWAQGLGVTEQMEMATKRTGRTPKAKGFLAYFQAFTNTYAPEKRLRQLYDEALRFPGVVGLCVGTRPDCLNAEILDLLTSYANRWMVWLELGLQSAHDDTLRFINRGHDFMAFANAAEEVAKRNILICTHLILGLPGESPEKARETAHRIATLPLHGVKLHSLYIVGGTRLERLFQCGDYTPWTRDLYVDTVCDVLERIPSHWVIQRLTGDPPAQRLIAPEWTLNKQGTLQAIRARLEERNTWQGRLLGAPSCL